MENDFLTTAALITVVAITVFVCLVAVVYFVRWLAEEWQLAGPRAVERMRRRLARAQERWLYDQELRNIQEQARFAAFGRRLIREISDPPFRKGMEVFGELRAVRAALANYGTVCFRTLVYLAASCDGLTASPWEVADLAPERRRTQLQVRAVAAAGVQALDPVNKDMIFDLSLVVWERNLRRIRDEVCPNCPVISAPELYRSGCPVMQMACEVKKDGNQPDAQQGTSTRKVV